MRKKTKINILLALFVFFSSYILIFEVAARFAVKSAEGFYGTLFGIELPPFDLIPSSAMPEVRDRSEWYEGLVIGGNKITVGDLWGYHRHDPLLGYAPLENTTSQNGWWQSNSIGAMARYEITESKQKRLKRILIFGDSFSSGSRVPQEMAWPNVLNSMNDTVEVVNFAVDGYGMAQAHLNYNQIRDRLDYDLVLLTFVPSSDLWRDINVKRDLRDWKLNWIMPRYILERSELKLIRNPFEYRPSFFESDPETADEELRSYLKTYDRFYFSAKYEEPWLVGKSILYKLGAAVRYNQQHRSLIDDLQSLDSEAMNVSMNIFWAMNDEVKQGGQEFVLVFLPSHYDLKLLKQNTDYQMNWERMVGATCSRDISCIDLSDELLQLSIDQLDKGYDGTHYGPQTNQLIAKSIEDHLYSEGILLSAN